MRRRLGAGACLLSGLLLASPTLAGSKPKPSAVDQAIARAERDFDGVRAELGLSGSAPMVGLEGGSSELAPTSSRAQAPERPAVQESSNRGAPAARH